MRTVFFLMGPTASGKTAAAVSLAERFPVDIISVDSGMVYRGLDIGTAKPAREVQEKAPHQLIDICDPAEPYSAAQFRKDALIAVENAFERGRFPLFVGGTMLYFHVFKNGLSVMPEANEEVRSEILEQANNIGWQAMHEKLKEIDPVSAGKIHPNDPQRIQRALEVYRLTGKTRTELWASQKEDAPFEIKSIALVPSDRAGLHKLIETRFYQMLEMGFLDEVKSLYDRGDLSSDLPSIRSVGYRQAWQYLAGNVAKEEMIELAVRATRQLAKRQLTWIRNWENLEIFDSQVRCFLDQVIPFFQKNRGGSEA